MVALGDGPGVPLGVLMIDDGVPLDSRSEDVGKSTSDVDDLDDTVVGLTRVLDGLAIVLEILLEGRSDVGTLDGVLAEGPEDVMGKLVEGVSSEGVCPDVEKLVTELLDWAGVTSEELGPLGLAMDGVPEEEGKGPEGDGVWDTDMVDDASAVDEGASADVLGVSDVKASDDGDTMLLVGTTAGKLDE